MTLTEAYQQQQLDVLTKELQARGYKFGPKVAPIKLELVKWVAWNPVRHSDWAACTHNEKPPTLIVSPSMLEVSPTYASVEFDLHGEVPGIGWVQLKSYGHKLEDTLVVLPEVERKLGEVWNKLHGD